MGQPLEQMKVGLFSTFDIEGGAARAAYRLHTGLRAIGVDSTYVVQSKKSSDDTVRGPETKWHRLLALVRPSLDQMPLRIYGRRHPTSFSTAMFGGKLGVSAHESFDIYNLHWINGGFASVSEIAKIDKPVVWTLHDSWPFTGGCHVPFDCDRFLRRCGSCPQLRSKREHDLSRHLLMAKLRYWDASRINIVAGSRWMADRARASAVFGKSNIHIIPPGLDTETFKPLDKHFARHALNIPPDRKVILFGAMAGPADANKGFHLLDAALSRLKQTNPDINLIAFGPAGRPTGDRARTGVRFVGRVNDDTTLALLYSAVDVTVVPSYQESFGQVAAESLSCGTPAVAFDATGPRDIIAHKENGYLARAYEPADLAAGIEWVLGDSDRWSSLSEAARRTALRKFDIRTCSASYQKLFAGLHAVSPPQN